MNQIKDYFPVIWAISAVLFLIGFAGLTFLEVKRLKKNDGLDKKTAWKYPVITNIVNIIVTPIAFIFVFYILAIVIMILLTIKDKKIIAENVIDAVFYSVVCFVSFCGCFIAFTVVRLITTNLMAKSLNLSWKYIMGQSAFLASLLIIVMFLFIAPFYMN